MPKFSNLKIIVCEFCTCPLLPFLLFWGWHVMGWGATLGYMGKDNTLRTAEQQSQRHLTPQMTVQSRANKPARLAERETNWCAFYAPVTWGLGCTTKPVFHLRSCPKKCLVPSRHFRYQQRSTMLA